MSFRLAALIVGVVLIIVIPSEHLASEALVSFVSSTTAKAKALWSKISAMTWQEWWIAFLPLGKRFIFVELPKRVTAMLLFIGVLSRSTRHRLRAWFKFVGDRFAGLTEKLRRYLGSTTFVILSLVATLIVLWFVWGVLEQHLLVLVGAAAWILKPIGWLCRILWGVSLLGTLQLFALRFITFLGMNQIGLFIIRTLVPNGVKRRARVLRIRFVRRVIRHKRLRRQQLQQMKHQPLERFKLAILMFRELRKAKTEEKDLLS